MAMSQASPVSAWSYLKAARKHHSQAAIAKHLEVDARTIRRWELRQTHPPAYVVHALQSLLPLQLPIQESGAFDYIDLFAGIGGIRIPFDEIGGRCVFTSEWDPYARKTYGENFRHVGGIAGDITQVRAEDVPDHDLLLAGFPCQPFSIAGVSKKNALGRAHGFSDETQGTLFFDVARIIEKKRPRAFLLENVKNLKSHDQGRTFEVITRVLSKDLGYSVHCKVIDGAHFVPQHRERILIAGFKESVAFDWSILNLPKINGRRLGEIFHRTDGSEPLVDSDGDRFFDHKKKRVNSKYTLTAHLWDYLQRYAEKHRAKGNGFGFGLFGPNDVARTLSARYYKDGSEILIKQSGGRNPRRLTPRECARLMGFPDTFKIPVSDTRAYKQFGNSVVVPVIREVARVMRPFICDPRFEQPEIPELAVT
jgi:DNA (cytosine-5)-methyltransferase 1